MDVLSWISLTVVAAIAVAAAAVRLRGKLVRREYGYHAHLSAYASGTVLLVCFLLLAVDGFADVGIKETVFDGWLDSVVDSIDGTSDRDERIARNRQGSGRGSLVNA